MTTETAAGSLDSRVADALESVGFLYFDDNCDDIAAAFGIDNLICALAHRNLKIVEMKDGE